MSAQVPGLQHLDLTHFPPDYQSIFTDHLQRFHNTSNTQDQIRVLTEMVQKIAKRCYLSLQQNQALSPIEREEHLNGMIRRFSAGLAHAEGLASVTGFFNKKFIGTVSGTIQKNFEDSLENAREEAERLREIISAKLQMTEKEKCSLSEISDEKAEKYILDQKILAADRAMKLLVQEEKVKAPIKKKNKTQMKKRSQKRASNTKEIQQTRSNPKEETIAKKDDSIQNLLIHLSSRKSGLKEHPRIGRWKTLDVDSIRTFIDFDRNGELIQRYKELSDRAIMWQRACHCISAIKLLTENAKIRKMYSFPTENGYGIFADLFFEGKCHHGVVYLGIGEGGILYHCCFEEIQNIKLMENIFQSNNRQESLDDSDDWSYVGDYCYESISDNGKITLRFTGEDHFLEIHPLRPDLLPGK